MSRAERTEEPVADEAHREAVSRMTRARSTIPFGMKEKHTPDELQMLSQIAANRGWEWTERRAERILAEFRAIGDL